MDGKGLGGMEVVYAWQNFLGNWSWSIFFTQTYSDEVRYSGLAIKRAINIVKQFFVAYKLDYLSLFVVSEPHQYLRKGCFHVHGLIGSNVDLLKLKNSLRFLWLLGREYGICRYESIEDLGGVRGYVSKYLVKNIADWELCEFFSNLDKSMMYVL